MLDSRPVPLPLDGIIVADLTQNVAGPFCTQTLGDMGADVVKVERPGRGDDARAWGPPFWEGESTIFLAVNRNKKSLAVDLKREAGIDVLRRLIQRADVFVQSLRAGVVEELGLDFAAAARLNPRLVYCSVTAFGTEGPLAAQPGYDPLMQAYGGLMSINGHPGQEPARVGTSIIDMGTGMWAALGIVAALRERDRTGRAVEVTTALFETALTWISYQAAGYFGDGVVPQPQGSGTAMVVPSQVFTTADGQAMISAGSDGLFQRLADALGEPGLANDPRFVDNPGRVRHRQALVAAISAHTRRLETADLLERLRAAGVPAAPDSERRSRARGAADEDERNDPHGAAPPRAELSRRRLADPLEPAAPWIAKRAPTRRRTFCRRAHLARIHHRRGPDPEGEGSRRVTSVQPR